MTKNSKSKEMAIKNATLGFQTSSCFWPTPLILFCEDTRQGSTLVKLATLLEQSCEIEDKRLCEVIRAVEQLQSGSITKIAQLHQRANDLWLANQKTPRILSRVLDAIAFLAENDMENHRGSLRKAISLFVEDSDHRIEIDRFNRVMQIMVK